jgi:hypothetical protein
MGNLTSELVPPGRDGRVSSPWVLVLIGAAFAAFSVLMAVRDMEQRRRLVEVSARTQALRDTIDQDHAWQVKHDAEFVRIWQMIYASVLRKEAMIRAMLKKGADHWTDADISRAIDEEIGNAKAAFRVDQPPPIPPPPGFKADPLPD